MIVCLEVLEPNRQIAIEVDHSARHAKYLPEGLHVANTIAKYGGKRRALRDGVMTEESLGPGNATMYLNGGKWSTNFVLELTTRIVDCKSNVGEVQSMSKIKYRRELNDEVPKHLYRNIVASMCPETVLTPSRVLRFARRTRDYYRGFFKLAKDGEEADSKERIRGCARRAKHTATSLAWRPAFLTSSYNSKCPFDGLHTTRDAKAGVVGVCSPGPCDRYMICLKFDHI